MTASLPPSIKFQPIIAGQTLPGGKVKFYAAGTSTPLAVYAADGTTPLGVELTLDANGATSFRLGSGLSYKIDLLDADDVPQAGWPEDRVESLDKFSEAIRDALLNDLSPAEGAALVAYNPEMSYPDGSVGKALASALTFPAADTVVTAAFQSADGVVSAAFAAADEGVTAAFQAADAGLSVRIAAVETGQSSGIVGYATQALLYADLVPVDKTVAYVTNDPTPANNGTYRKSGATGAGSWVQSSFDRVAVVEGRATALETAAAGIGTTYDAFTGNGVLTSTYMAKPTSDSYLLSTKTWEGDQKLYPTVRTNIASYSQDITNWVKGTNVVVSPNAIAAPDGTMTADLVDTTAAAALTGVATSGGGSIGNNYVTTVWMKGFAGGEHIQLCDYGNEVNPPVEIYLTTSWEQYSYETGATTAALTGPSVRSWDACKFYAWGGQTILASQAPIPSSYIPVPATTPVSVTDYTVGANNLITFASPRISGDVVLWKNPNDLAIKLDSSGLMMNRQPFFYIDTTANNNVHIGSHMNALTTGHFNATLGNGAMQNTTTGYTNVAIGTLAANANTSGSGLVAVGTQACFSNTTAYYNVGIGDGALSSTTTGPSNVGVGNRAGYSNVTGSYNIFLGDRAGFYQTAASSMLFIDSYPRANAAAELTDALVVGQIAATPANQWFKINGKFGVNGATPPAKPTITGSRSGNAALALLLTALADYGFITDGTSA